MYLMDTHTFLWYINDDPQIPELVRLAIESNVVYISIISFWEMAIKVGKGKLRLPTSISQLMADCREFGFRILPIRDAHLNRLVELENIHGDPFDRLLICQAQEENLIFLTKDHSIQKYPIKYLWDNYSLSGEL